MSIMPGAMLGLLGGGQLGDLGGPVRALGGCNCGLETCDPGVGS